MIKVIVHSYISIKGFIGIKHLNLWRALYVLSNPCYILKKSNPYYLTTNLRQL